ncbi:hypothetical protein K1719_047398 [Acacia pycnantha]|nr:hypothetical protein K1719_047398 [Acacia pycnantha]
MIGRADIEGSKSNVAMNAWLPQAVPVKSAFGAGKGPRRAVPDPSPAGTRQPALAAGAARAIRRRPDGFGAGTPCPALEPILFPRLRIHFADFPCLHCSIDRRLFTLETDAVMSTAGRGRHTVLRIFKGRRGCRTPRDVRCSSGRWTLPPELALELRLSEGNFGGNPLLDGSISLSPLYPSQTNDLHVSIAAGLHEFPAASPRSGIVHHLSGPDGYALTRTLHRRSRSVGGATHEGIPPVGFLAPYGFTRPLTRTHVRLLGPCFKTGRMGSSRADAGARECRARRDARAPGHDRGDDVSAGISTAGLGPPPQSALGRNLPPDWGCIPKQPDSPTAPRGATGSGHDGALTLSAPLSGGLGPGPPARTLLRTTIRTRGGRFSWWAVPVRSPLLGNPR